MIKITRADPLGTMPKEGESTSTAILSVEKFEDWPAAFEYLKQRDIPLTAEHEAEISNNKDTQFSWKEFVEFAGSAWMCNVQYDIRVVE